MLAGLRVIELADELAEYCGLLLAGLGAEVIKIEPPGGSATRRIGPFYRGEADPEKSLFFWTYNRAKRSVILDPDNPSDRSTFERLLGSVDVVLDGSSERLANRFGLYDQTPSDRHPELIVARMTAFGDDGPWKDYLGSDLVHLALGGVMMNCGYDAAPDGRYDLPPMAPQVWHAYHIAGEQLAIGIVAALIHRHHTGEGQEIACAVHEAVSKNTELDVMSWIMRRVPIYRQTCRHANEKPSRVPTICHTKDGRWMMSWGASATDKGKLVPFLDRFDMAADLQAPQTGGERHARNVPGSGASDEATAHALEVIQRFVRAHCYDNLPWREAQDAGLLWAPLRKPHENAEDPHWLKRGTFADIPHPEIGRTLRYPVSKWRSTATSWQIGTRAPLLGEHTHAVLNRIEPPRISVADSDRSDVRKPRRRTPDGRPFPLQGIRIFDFSWFLASAGGTRFAAALGAESIKVEWKENPDTRFAAMAPVGGREMRRNATAPLPPVNDPNMGGQFHNKNSGKRGLSLNVRHPQGLEIAKKLIAISDVVAEGFSPGVLDRLGLGYDVMKSIKPDIIYVQQSGMGSFGTYGRFRTVGPVAASFAGMSHMSGLPEPAMPVGWGYSYLDWIGAYGFALAIIGALYHRDRTGQGQWIDSSQCESGIFLAGAPILDYYANGQAWTRYGNRSPYKPAAPHGAYPTQGVDRWIAIACFDERQWSALCTVAGHPDWARDPRFASLEGRLTHQDALDQALASWTRAQQDYDCMHRLQQAGVPAGVCQNAEDRCDNDPQLRALDWLTEVTGSKIGTWPVPELPMKLSASPAYIGGPFDRGAPCYGEDNEYVLGELLGYSSAAIARLAEDNII
ncbi:MAG: CoA transferase [Gammaproteobacteria bacterium]|nr:CoA transferase [Gammaproteobacteria bacterium]